MTSENLYWITRLDSFKSYIQGFSIFTTLITIIVGTTCLIGYILYKNAYNDDEKQFTKSIWKMCFPISLCAFILTILCDITNLFLPTTKEYFVIKTLPVICSETNIDKAKQLIPEALDATSEWIKSLKNSKK